MFHHEIMQSLMTERARELRAEAGAARDARLARRAREYWAERAERLTPRQAGRRRHHNAAAVR
ncbi:hypothetical protein [Actinomadura sp. WMMA1423]|uniref:hypothetical protein n=1 Tax=Actinomadura sp. WMMA1423 TaxID=2591108 RepID=UPI00143DE1CD|nr:hypothetical protein [Actinomadura sp. WMMA1423]